GNEDNAWQPLCPGERHRRRRVQLLDARSTGQQQLHHLRHDVRRADLRLHSELGPPAGAVLRRVRRSRHLHLEVREPLGHLGWLRERGLPAGVVRWLPCAPPATWQ
ncbi:unnamed protein product, partial [Effrenium voratum]